MPSRSRPLVVRAALVLFGSLLVLVGVIGLFLPVMPGWILVVPGLAVLAGEFVWARRLLEGARAQLDRVRKVVDGQEREAA